MNGVVIMVISIVVLGGAYLLYGRYLAKKWGIDPKAKTPAYEMEDGVDYVPTDKGVVLVINLHQLQVLVQLMVQFRLQFLAGCLFCYGCLLVAFSLVQFKIFLRCMHL